MTRNPGSLQDLEAQFEKQIGPFWKGTVADEHHFNGYHLGGFEVPPDDYSITHPRDLAGIRQYGGYWASAVDPGMEWAASRLWLTWLVREGQAGRLPDVVEIIGSPDGRQDFRWEASKDFHMPTLWYRDHIRHTHISLFRDSIFRGHSYLFDGWTATGQPTPSFAAEASTGVTNAAETTPNVTVPNSDTRTGGSSGATLRGALLGVGVAGVAWVIKRRMEVAREDSQ